MGLWYLQDIEVHWVKSGLGDMPDISNELAQERLGTAIMGDQGMADRV